MFVPLSLTTFFAAAMVVALSGTIPVARECTTDVRRNSAGVYYIQCDPGWSCESGDCDVQDNQVGNTHYYYCGCGDFSEPDCNGWLRSRRDWDEGGDDVGCFVYYAPCVGQQVCDEAQVPVPPEGGEFGGWVPLCTCKRI